MNLSTLNDIDPDGEGSASRDEETAGLEALDEQETEFVATTAKKPINQTALMLFGILTVGGAGLWAMNVRSGPQSARAADPTAAVAQTTIHDFMQRGGKTNISLLRSLLDGTAKIVEQFRIPTVVQVPLSELKANPFHFATGKVAVVDDGSDAARKRKEDEKLAIQTAVRGLQLQSLVLRANHKACMVNNTLYGEGDTVDDFTIVSITNEGVVVQQAGYRFRLQMAR